MARISELHYSNAYAQSSGVAEFLEVALSPSEDPADFTVSFYQANGNVGIEIPLSDPGVQFFVDPDNGEEIYVISADNFNILLTDPNGGGSNNFEAYALVDTANSTVIDFYDIGGGTQNITANNGLAQGATSVNLPVLVGPNQTTTTLQFNQPNPGTLTYATVGAGDTGIACFVAGTQIDTPTGPRAIETLRPGDLVCTRDSGPMPVQWVGDRTVCGLGVMAPVCLRRGAMGATQDVFVSPQHRVFVSSWKAELMFATPEVLVPAVALIDGDLIVQQPRRRVRYVHILLEQHEIVRTHGVESESMLLTQNSAGAWGAAHDAELAALFPERAAGWSPWIMARPELPKHLARAGLVH